MTFLDIGDEHYIVCEQVICVKKINEKKCSLWLCGQSALEGFVVEKSAKELIDEIIEACAEEDEPGDEDKDDQDED